MPHGLSSKQRPMALSNSQSLAQSSMLIGCTHRQIQEQLKNSIFMDWKIHQRRCLDYIRKAFYPRHYFPNETHNEVNYHKGTFVVLENFFFLSLSLQVADTRSRTCIEHLRHSIMCSGDFTLDHWKKSEVMKKNWLKTDIPHICRDSGAMRDWGLKFKFNKPDWVLKWGQNESLVHGTDIQAPSFPGIERPILRSGARNSSYIFQRSSCRLAISCILGMCCMSKNTMILGERSLLTSSFEDHSKSFLAETSNARDFWTLRSSDLHTPGHFPSAARQFFPLFQHFQQSLYNLRIYDPVWGQSILQADATCWSI